MKNASASLISFLATANQAVAWDVYTITLADGTVLTYSTRDPSSVTPPVPPPPDPHFILDSFAGGGDLSTHTGFTGGPWVSVAGSPLSSFLLDTAPQIRLRPANGAAGSIRTTGNPAANTSNFVLDATFVLATWPQNGAHTATIFAYDNWTDKNGVAVTWNTPAAFGGNYTNRVTIKTPTSYYDSGDIVSNVQVNTCLLAIVLQSNRLVVGVNKDSLALIPNQTLPTAMLNFGVCGLYLENSASSPNPLTCIPGGEGGFAGYYF